MANEEHLNILKKGVDVWNQWRKENPDIRPDLIRANLIGVNLSRANLGQTNLGQADLNGAILIGAILIGANPIGANLSNANLIGANLSNANLIGANLSNTDLSGANLSKANLEGVILSQASVEWTTFGDIDLSTVKGLDTVKHRGPSTIGIDTIYLSQGKISEVFLRGAGVPDTFITYIASLTGQAIQYYSCFISYSSKDTALAERLHADLQQKGVRCWFAPEDLKIGERIRVGIDQSIRVHDKLLLILSEHSLASDWVEQEVETAMEQERQRKETVLFPIRVDEAVMQESVGWAAHLKRTRNIGNFSRWRKHEPYQKALQRLLRDLKIENA